MKPTTTNWLEIRQYYETTGESLRATATKFQVSERTLYRRSTCEGWQKQDEASANSSANLPSPSAISGGSSAISGEASANSSANLLNQSAISGEVSASSSANLPSSSAIPVGASAISPANLPNNGTGTNLAAKNGTGNGTGNGSGTAEMAPVPEVGSTGGSNTPKNGTAAIIPANINTFDQLAAAQFYFGTLGWAVHPLYGPDRGEPKERGKKPIHKGWREHTAADITQKDLANCFAPGTRHNLGCVVRPPFVHVDLDSKPDAGASVMEWLATMPELAAVPRERTGGGAHLAFICRDLPEAILKSKQAPTCKINDKVDAELYLNGLNLVLSPSVHKSGHQYTWEVTGEIPQVSWHQLCQWFGFATFPLVKRN